MGWREEERGEEMKRKGRKYLALVTALILLFSVFPGYSFAEEADEQIQLSENTGPEQQVYEIQYLLQDTDEPVPGLGPITAYADVGTTVTVSHPAAEGYQVLDEQPEELLISENPELNKVVVYYATCEDQEEPASTTEQQVYEIQYLLQNTKRAGSRPGSNNSLC